MKSVLALFERWTAEAAQLRSRYGMEAAARLCEAHAEELREALHSVDDELLSIPQAAAESGYSRQHLRALLAGGTVPNAGAKGRPRIRRADLPRKPNGSTRDAEPHETPPPRRAAPRSRGAFDARRLVRGK